ELHGSYSFRNQLCRLRPDYVNSEDLSVLGIRHNLDETFVFADYARARIRGKRKFPDFHAVALLAGLGFGQTHAANLRMAERHIRNAQQVNRLVFLARDLRDSNNSLHRADVRQLRRAEHNVAMEGKI